MVLFEKNIKHMSIINTILVFAIIWGAPCHGSRASRSTGIRAHWSEADDKRLAEIIETKTFSRCGKPLGFKWSQVALEFPGRCGKQCLERWREHLRPGINREAFTEDEIRRLNVFIKKGNRNWSQLARDEFPGRTDLQLRNFFYGRKFKKWQETGELPTSPPVKKTRAAKRPREGQEEAAEEGPVIDGALDVSPASTVRVSSQEDIEDKDAWCQAIEGEFSLAVAEQKIDDSEEEGCHESDDDSDAAELLMAVVAKRPRAMPVCVAACCTTDSFRAVRLASVRTTSVYEEPFVSLPSHSWPRWNPAPPSLDAFGARVSESASLHASPEGISLALDRSQSPSSLISEMRWPTHCPEWRPPEAPLDEALLSASPPFEAREAQDFDVPQ